MLLDAIRYNRNAIRYNRNAIRYKRNAIRYYNYTTLTTWLRTYSPVCILWCSFRFLSRVNPFPHTWHWKGLYPVWVNSWSRRCPIFLNILSQYLHFLVRWLWVLMCWRSVDSSVNVCVHSPHWWIRLPAQVVMCSSSSGSSVNTSPHFAHWFGFKPPLHMPRVTWSFRVSSHLIY